MYKWTFTKFININRLRWGRNDKNDGRKKNDKQVTADKTRGKKKKEKAKTDIGGRYGRRHGEIEIQELEQIGSLVDLNGRIF